jgi:hypothetical protein
MRSRRDGRNLNIEHAKGSHMIFTTLKWTLRIGGPIVAIIAIAIGKPALAFAPAMAASMAWS